MKKILILKYLFLLIPCTLFSQVGIGTDSPSSSSILHIVAPNKTLKLPVVNDMSTFLGGGTKVEEGALLFDSTVSTKKCLRFIQPDLSESECLLTKDDVYSASEQSSSLSSTVSVTTTSYTNLVAPITISGSPTKRTAVITLDAIRNVSVAAAGNCSSTDFRLVEVNTSTSTETVLYSATSNIIPRYASVNDIFGISKVEITQLNQTDNMEYRFQYRRGGGCPTTGTNEIMDANMSIVVY